ncbi:MAG: ribonuclease HII [Leptospiraceae bacterium]|nr:ribonuclease HII [Leptospiraceae bacterium]
MQFSVPEKLQIELSITHSLKQQNSWALSVDEVGRGSLFGPVVVAGMVWNVDTLRDLQQKPYFSKIGDSKKISAVNRALLNKQLSRDFHFETVSISVGFIEKYNISRAVFYGIYRIIQNLNRNNIQVKYLLLDGKDTFKTRFWRPHFRDDLQSIQLEIPARAVVKGDNLCATIGAASIVAKEYRDKMIHKADSRYPGYFLATNSGYGTLQHREALQKLGATRLHRKSFLSKILRSDLREIDSQENQQ